MELSIHLPHGEERIALTGAAERNLKIIREALGVRIVARNGMLHISGPEQAVSCAAQVLEQLWEAARRRQPMTRRQLLDSILQLEQRSASSSVAGATSAECAASALEVYTRGRRIVPMTQGQQLYLETIFQNDLTFCIGPAGTGKTYLAVAAAVSMLRRSQVRKLVLVRPAVEAGEKLGYLPGDIQAKVHPYLRPLLDALHDMMDFEQIQRFMACDLIEIIPLAFMRGRTLNDALIILDEAQNTTRPQMLMFLTRLGRASKMIVTGDITQIDLPDPRQSGLVDALRRLRKIPGVGMVQLSRADIVRHHLVQRVVEAYGKNRSHHRTPKPTTSTGGSRTDPAAADGIPAPPQP